MRAIAWLKVLLLSPRHLYKSQMTYSELTMVSGAGTGDMPKINQKLTIILTSNDFHSGTVL